MKAPIDSHHFAYRVIADAWADASRAYWIRRAELFEWALPRPTDFVPAHVAPEVREERRRRLTELANACRARAAVAHGCDVELRDAMKDEVLGRLSDLHDADPAKYVDWADVA